MDDVAELKVTAPGITKTTVKKTCLTKRKGTCVKSKSTTTKQFWLDEPTCPASGQVTFRSDYGYETGPRHAEDDPGALPEVPAVNPVRLTSTDRPPREARRQAMAPGGRQPPNGRARHMALS